MGTLNFIKLCGNCKSNSEDHVDGKCLYEAATFQPTYYAHQDVQPMNGMTYWFLCHACQAKNYFDPSVHPLDSMVPCKCGEMTRVL